MHSRMVLIRISIQQEVRKKVSDSQAIYQMLSRTSRDDRRYTEKYRGKNVHRGDSTPLGRVDDKDNLATVLEEQFTFTCDLQPASSSFVIHYSAATSTRGNGNQPCRAHSRLSPTTEFSAL